MTKNRETKLKGPYAQIHSAIWLIGLAILAIKGWWWPGILFLIAFSAIVQAAIQLAVPEAVEEVQPEAENGGSQETAYPSIQAAPASKPAEHPLERLPGECPRCSAPIRGGDVRWTGPFSADCPYCGANLPLKTA